MWNRLLISGCLLIASLSVRAESSVWKLTRDNRTVYLGGTVHVLRATDLPLPPEFETAYKASQTVYFETDIGRMQSPELQQIVLSRGVFADGTTLEQVLTPSAWKLARDYCTKAGLPLEQIKPLKPWLFTLMITAVELQKLGVSSEGVDTTFHSKAVKDGKSVGMLESFEEQIGYLVNMGAGHESELIENSLTDLHTLPKIVDGLLQAWKTGDLARIDEYMLTEVRAKYPPLFEELIVSRNKAWLPKIEALTRTPETEFVLVGVGHIAGEEGLLAALKARGFTAEQVH